MSSRTLSVCCLCLLAHPAASQEWARFRGPNGAGISAAALPASWSETDINWKVAVPGSGHSSPVLWGKKIFLTSATASGARLVLCYSADDGKELWRHEAHASKYHIHQRNSFATATPVVDDKRVYVSWATAEQYTVAAFDHEGKPAWQHNLGPYKSQHGFGVSPIRVDDLVIVPNDQDDGGNLVALDAGDGAVRWTIPRQPKNATYSTPCVFKAGERSLIIFTNWKHGVTAVDPKDGKVAWELSVFNTKTQERAIASPIVAGDLILSTCGFVTGVKHHVAVRVGADGKPAEAWRVERQVAYLPTPVAKGERIYLVSEQGWATCLERKTGKQIWQERVGTAFSSSPVIVGETLYCIANNGVVHMLKTGDKFEEAGKFDLGEGTQCTPAVACGRMFIRTEKHLLSIGGK
jgi:outer membrane protein assembly factor BamB